MIETTTIAQPVEVAGQPAARRRAISPVLRFVLRRLVGAVVSLFAVSVLIFLVLQILPGDVAAKILGRTASPEAVAQLRSDLGLDRPLITQYQDWIGGLLTADLGSSAIAVANSSSDPSVWAHIETPLTNSIYLAGTTILVLVPLGVTLGTLAAVRAGKASDQAISVTALALGAMPEFLVGTVLIGVFFSWLDLFPPVVAIAPGESPLSHPDALVLPVSTLVAVSAAFIVRMVRAGTIESLHQDYVAMARLNGVRERRVIWRYGLRNALAPSIQAVAQSITFLAGGIIITESVFNYPGIGQALVQAVNVRDVTVIAGITMILAAFYIVINLLADLVVALVVPKLRTSL